MFCSLVLSSINGRPKQACHGSRAVGCVAVHRPARTKLDLVYLFMSCPIRWISRAGGKGEVETHGVDHWTLVGEKLTAEKRLAEDAKKARHILISHDKQRTFQSLVGRGRTAISLYVPPLHCDTRYILPMRYSNTTAMKT